MKRARLRVAGVSDTATKKQTIQDLLRFIGVARDKGCVLRNLRHCGGDAKFIYTLGFPTIQSQAVIQYDHLITRANSATFADSRLGVCICKPCHLWKKYHEKEYEKLIKSILPKERVVLWERCEEDRQAHRTWKPDWSLAIVLLRRELECYEKRNEVRKSE